MFENVWKCVKMSENIWKCLKMSENVWLVARLEWDLEIPQIHFSSLGKMFGISVISQNNNLISWYEWNAIDNYPNLYCGVSFTTLGVYAFGPERYWSVQQEIQR